MIFRNYFFDGYLLYKGKPVGARYVSDKNSNTELQSVLDVSFVGARMCQGVKDMHGILSSNKKASDKLFCFYIDCYDVGCFNLFYKDNKRNDVEVNGMYEVTPVEKETRYVNSVYYNGFVVRYENPKHIYDIAKFLTNISKVIYGCGLSDIVWARSIEIGICETPQIIINSDFDHREMTAAYLKVLEKKINEALLKYLRKDSFSILDPNRYISRGNVSIEIEIQNPDGAFKNMSNLPEIPMKTYRYVRDSNKAIRIFEDGGFSLKGRTEDGDFKVLNKLFNTLGYSDFLPESISPVDYGDFSKVILYSLDKHGRLECDCRRYYDGDINLRDMKKDFDFIEQAIKIFDEISYKSTITVSRTNRIGETVFYRDYVFDDNNPFNVGIEEAVKTANEIIVLEGMSCFRDRQKVSVRMLNDSVFRLEYIVEHNDIGP